MKLLRVILLGCCSAFMSVVQSQPIQLIGASKIENRYRFDNDTSLLNLFIRWAMINRYEVTYTGRHELPLVPELNSIEAVTFRDAIATTLDMYKNHDLGVVMFARIDDEMRHLYLSSATTNEPLKPTKTVNASETGFSVSEADKSLMQVLVRWAYLADYQAVINDQLVNMNAFPRHPSRYADYSLIDSVKKFKTQSSFKDAVKQLLIMYSGRSLAPFTVSVDESTKLLSIASLKK